MFVEIFRIEQVITEIPTHSTKTLVFYKRLSNSKGKKAFGSEMCDMTFVSPLKYKDQLVLTEFLNSNPGIKSDFEKYEKPIDSILNMPLFCINDTEKGKLIKLVDRKFMIHHKGLIDREISNIISRDFNEFGNSTNRNVTLQFPSP